MALLDTGADINCVSYDLIQQAALTHLIKPLTLKQDFVSAGSQSLQPRSN